MLASCAWRLPTLEETTASVSRLRDHDAWAWALGIGLIWADLVLPVPQTAIIAALGVVSAILGRGKTDEDEVENGHRQA